MQDSTLTIILTSGATMLLAAGSVFVSILNSFRGSRIEKKVDGSMTELREEAKVANQRLEASQEMISKLLGFYPTPAPQPAPTRVEVVNAPTDPVPTSVIKKP